MSIFFHSVTTLKQFALCDVDAAGDTGHTEIDMGGLPSADSQASLIAALTNGWVKFKFFIRKFNVLTIVHLDHCGKITQHG